MCGARALRGQLMGIHSSAVAESLGCVMCAPPCQRWATSHPRAGPLRAGCSRWPVGEVLDLPRQHVRLERPQRLEREDVGGSSRSRCAISGSSWCGS